MRILRALWRAYVAAVKAPGGRLWLAVPPILLLGAANLVSSIAKASGSDSTSDRTIPIEELEQRNRAAAGENTDRWRPARADSVLATLRGKRDESLPDSLLVFVHAYATRASDSVQYDRAFTLLVRRQAKVAGAQRAERVRLIVADARSRKAEGEACRSVSSERASALVAAHPVWDDDAVITVMCHWIYIGMTAEQLRASRGKPDRLHKSVYSWGTKEQWVYGEYDSFYVYVENDVVKGWSS